MRPSDFFQFRFVEEAASDSPTLAEIVLAAKNVALLFSYDRRDRMCDLRVAKMEGDPANLFGWDLATYLRDFCGYRGGLSDGLTRTQYKKLAQIEHLVRELRWYASIIHAHAPSIVDDTETFVPTAPRG